ncbi:MAG: anaerobic glycerol-3-phosphate dehydrogenase subunit A [Desulfobacteraceae bacterium]|nr:anaerobic glycerol-3-phosphate dehydrogenase subunit A [Desulfobacteraceae bacterium]
METDILIIGGGATGTGIARDLALRGFKIVLIEKKDLNAGASGANHGLLHSGARYVFTDLEAAIECRQEGDILKKTARHCIEQTNGLFVAIAGDDEKYIADFPSLCKKGGIPCKSVDINAAKEMEPALARDIIAAYEVKDASINPFKLCIENISDAVQKGGRFLNFCKVKGFEIQNHHIAWADIHHEVSDSIFRIKARAYINASGAWANQIAAMAGLDIGMVYSKGSLLVTNKRITQRVINRLRKPSDGDILVPGGVVSLLGTTSLRVDSPDNIFPTVREVDDIIKQAEKMVPKLQSCRYIRAYSGVRPLVSSGSGDDRHITRGFTLLDHEKDGIKNFVTITGGKLSTFRLMAEKTCDVICKKYGNKAQCLTGQVPLPSTKTGEWSEPGVSPFKPFRLKEKQDMFLCECEMVPQSAVDTIISTITKEGGKADLSAIALRSRIGKGPCQGAFCSARILSYMYNSGQLNKNQGILDLKQFLNQRWKGEQSLLWDQALVQSSLKESIHCALFGLELERP